MKKNTCPLVPAPINASTTSISDLIDNNSEVSIIVKNDFGTSVLDAKTYPSGGNSVTFSQMPFPRHKYEFAADIEVMLKEGIPQKEIAKRLNISPSYVSYLRKKNKTN